MSFQNRQNAFQVVGLFDEHFPEQGRQLGAVVAFFCQKFLDFLEHPQGLVPLWKESVAEGPGVVHVSFGVDLFERFEKPVDIRREQIFLRAPVKAFHAVAEVIRGVG
ncbi:hypothetical protein Ptc2401_00188 [Prosthecochloris sp. CIB 2401]|nr:hypothetical protein Ptc2401_00188 [Prosthecochloris sp. CIB 2401]